MTKQRLIFISIISKYLDSKTEIISDEKSDLILEDFKFCKDYILITYSNGINNSSRKLQRIQINMKNKNFQQRKTSMPPNKSVSNGFTTS